jgi:hypothetical protein
MENNLEMDAWKKDFEEKKKAIRKCFFFLIKFVRPPNRDVFQSRQFGSYAIFSLVYSFLN